MKNDQDTDGTNAVAEDIDVPCKFQPMQKRFLMWDKGLQKFYEDSNGTVSSVGLYGLAELLNVCGRPLEQIEVIQSTNLFDKNGKEIFEGSIVKYHDRIYLVVFTCGDFTLQDQDGFYNDALGHSKYYSDWDATNPDRIEVIGHVLPNPELWEEE